MPNSHEPTADIAESFGSGQWEFTPAVAEVFDDHVRASVPFYDAIQDLVAEASDWLLPDGGLVVDLGVATGTTVHRITQRHEGRSVRAVLYDTEQHMLERAADRLGTEDRDYVCQRVQDPPLKHADADLTLALFTLQFLPLRDRLAALRNARMTSSETGALIVAEKLRPSDSRWAEIANDVSHDYKASHGISDSAIRAKSRALRGVLVPYPSPTLTSLIEAAGWRQPETLFRWHQWAVVGAFATTAGL